MARISWVSATISTENPHYARQSEGKLLGSKEAVKLLRPDGVKEIGPEATGDGHNVLSSGVLIAR